MLKFILGTQFPCGINSKEWANRTFPTPLSNKFVFFSSGIYFIITFDRFRDIKLSDFCPSVVGNSSSLHDENTGLNVKSIFDLTGQACHRELERISSVQFAVSGPRKVAAFLFENKKRIRIYDMEVEEASDDEDDEENEIMGGQSSGLSSSELNTSH